MEAMEAAIEEEEEGWEAQGSVVVLMELPLHCFKWVSRSIDRSIDQIDRQWFE
jgi:hypothetical protein